jgi:hypothetical protein
MSDVKFHWHYSLTRRQRLIPLLNVWGINGLIGVVLIVAVIHAGNTTSGWWFLAVVPLVFLLRGLFVGLVDVILRSRREMDVLVEKNGLGFVAGGERWYVFLDGIISIAKYQSDVWTIQHWNGTVINIPSDIVTEEQLNYLRDAAQRGSSAGQTDTR